MADAPSGLGGKVILVVEDQFLLAQELKIFLQEHGATVVGPAASLHDALALIVHEGARLDGAVLDINLHNERVYPAADVLMAAGVPIVFATGYDELAIGNQYWDVPLLEKPIDHRRLAKVLAMAISGVRAR